MLRKVREAVDFLRSKCAIQPQIGIILGSGLGDYADELKEAVRIPYADIPYFPRSSIEGHVGRLVIGKAEGVPAVVMQGRVHHYEGYSMQEVTFPVRVMGALGARKLIVTNAAGGINKKFFPGLLMIIKDHINLMGTNPLIGENIAEFGPRFPDMTEAYDRALRRIAERAAKEANIPVASGIYVAVTGPSYETPAEIRAFRRLGADAVGMSTVPEVIVANHMGMRVLGISCISNMAAGVLPKKLEHSEVVETARRIRDKFIALLRLVIPRVSST